MNPLRLVADLLYRLNARRTARETSRRWAATEARHRQNCLACRDSGDSHA